MTNEQIINIAYAAFKEGMLTHETGDISVVRFGEIADQFNKWLADNYPHLLKVYEPRDLYWHEFGCMASVYTANRTGDCHCDGHLPGEGPVAYIPIKDTLTITSTTFKQRFEAIRDRVLRKI